MDVKNEAKDNEGNAEVISEWLEPSPVGAEYVRHEVAMEPASRVPVHKAFALAPGFDVGMLRKMAETYKPKRIVVIDHGENGFEVRRLFNNADVSLFYASAKQTGDEGLPLLRTVVAEYSNSAFEEVERYKAAISENMKKDNVVSYSFIHKRLSKMAAAKNSAGGQTSFVKAAIEEAKEAGIISEVSTVLCKELYETTARLFKIA